MLPIAKVGLPLFFTLLNVFSNVALGAPQPVYHPNKLIIEFKDNIDTNAALTALRLEAAKHQLEFVENMIFDTLMSGVSISTNEPHNQDIIDLLNSFDSVLDVHNVGVHRQAPVSPSLSNNNNVSPFAKRDGQNKPASNFTITSLDGSKPSDIHKVTGVDKLHKEGLSGKGIKIGIVNTGVDYKHPELGNGKFGPEGSLFKYGYDFVGDEYPSETFVHTPDSDPYTNCSEVGTAHSGVVAGQGPNINGVAPNVTLGTYRVGNCLGSGYITVDNLIKGMEKAYDDGMDIIAVPITDIGWAERAPAAVAAKLAKEDVIIVAAAGYGGWDGLFTSSNPGVAEGVISVADATGNVLVKNGINVQAPSLSKSIFAWFAVQENIFTSKEPVQVVLATDSKNANDGCNPYTNDVKGKVVFALSGTCENYEKAQVALKAGAVALVIGDAQGDIIMPSPDNPPDIPYATITKSDTDLIFKDLKDGKQVTVSGYSGLMSIKNPSAGQIPHHNSWGPTPELELSTDLVAPGSDIFSTAPVDMGSYLNDHYFASFSTSYIAGVAALLLEKHGKEKTKLIKNLIIQHTSLIASDDDKFTTAPLSQGNGFIDAYAAANAKIVAEKSNLALNYTTDIKQIDRNLTIRNLDTQKPTTLTFKHIAAPSYTQFFENGTYTTSPINSTKVAEVQPLQPIKIEAGKNQTVKVSITPPKDLPNCIGWVYSGIIQAKTDCNETINIPYMGFQGDYKKMPIFPTDPTLEPGLFYNTTASPEPVPIDSKTPYQINNDASILFNLTTIHPTRVIKTELVKAENNETVGYLPGGYMEYNGKINGWFFDLMSNTEINGTYYKTADTQLKEPQHYPGGKYFVKVSALKMFADPNNKLDYYTWDSKPFTIAIDDSKKK